MCRETGEGSCVPLYFHRLFFLLLVQKNTDQGPPLAQKFPHVGEAATQWPPLPLSPLVFTYKYKGDEEGKKRQRKGHTRREGANRGEKRERREEQRRRKKIEENREREVKRRGKGRRTTANHRATTSTTACRIQQQWWTIAATPHTCDNIYIY